MLLKHNVTLGNDTIVVVWISSEDAAAVAQKGFRLVHQPSDYFYLVPLKLPSHWSVIFLSFVRTAGRVLGWAMILGSLSDIVQLVRSHVYSRNSWRDPFKTWQKVETLIFIIYPSSHTHIL